MLSDAVSIEIADTLRLYLEAYSEASKLVESITEKRERFLEMLTKPGKTDYEKALLFIIGLKHAANDSHKALNILSSNLELDFNRLKNVAMTDGVYEYYSAIEIPKAKVTESMREAYALKDDSLVKLSKLANEVSAQKQALLNEVNSFYASEVSLRKFVREVGGI